MTELRKPIDYPFLGKNYKSYSDLGRAFANDFDSAKREIFTKKFLNYIKSADLFLYGEIKQEIMRTKYANNAVSTVIYKLNPKLGIILKDLQIKNFEEFINEAASPDLEVRTLLLQFLEDHCLSHIFKALEKDDTKTEAFWNMIVEVEDQASTHDYVLTYLVYVWNYKRDALSSNSFKELDTYVTILEEGKGHLFTEFEKIKRETPFLGYIAYEYGFAISNVFDQDTFMSLFDFLNFASKNVKFVFDNFFSKSPVLWVLANYNEYEFLGAPATSLKEDIIEFNKKLAIKQKEEELSDTELAIYQNMLKERDTLEASNPFNLDEDIALEDEKPDKTVDYLKDTSDIDDITPLDSLDVKKVNEESLDEKPVDSLEDKKEDEVVLDEKPLDSSEVPEELSDAVEEISAKDEENTTEEISEEEIEILSNKELKAKAKAEAKALKVIEKNKRAEEAANKKAEKLAAKAEAKLAKAEKNAEKEELERSKEEEKEKAKELKELQEEKDEDLKVKAQLEKSRSEVNDVEEAEIEDESLRNVREDSSVDQDEVPDELINRKKANEQTIEFNALKEQLMDEDAQLEREKQEKLQKEKASRTRTTTSVEIIAEDFGHEVEIFNEARDLYERFVNQFVYSSVIKDETSIYAKNRSGIYDLTTPFDKHFLVSKEFLIEEGLTTNAKDITALEKIEITKRNLLGVLDDTKNVLHQTSLDAKVAVTARNASIIKFYEENNKTEPKLKNRLLMGSTILFLISVLALFLHVIYTYKPLGNQWNNFFYYIGLDGIKDHSTYLWLRGDAYTDFLPFIANLVIILGVFALLAGLIVNLVSNKKPKELTVEGMLNKDLGRNHQGEGYISERISNVKRILEDETFSVDEAISLPEDYSSVLTTVYNRKEAIALANTSLTNESKDYEKKKLNSHPILTAILFALGSSYISYILTLLVKEFSRPTNSSYFDEIIKYITDLNQTGNWLYLGIGTYIVFRIFKRKDNAFSVVLLTVANAIVIILFVVIKALIK